MSSCLVGAFEFFFWKLFGYWNRDEEMRWWCHQSEARHAFLKRDEFLLGILELKHHFHYEKEWLVNELEHVLGMTLRVFILVFLGIPNPILPTAVSLARVPTVIWFLTGCIKTETLFSLRKLYWKPRPWWHWVKKDGTHFFAGHSDTRTESIVYPDRKCESSFRRPLIAATQL